MTVTKPLRDLHVGGDAASLLGADNDTLHAVAGALPALCDVADAAPDPDKLEYIADTLDLLTPIVAAALEGAKLSGEDRTVIREWLRGTAQQDDLRQWAASIRAALDRLREAMPS